LVEAGEVVEEKRGKPIGVMLPKVPSDAPVLYIPPEEHSEGSEAFLDLEEVRV
jgi:hypothetical protein